EDMSAPWQPHTCADSFKEQILALVKEKVEAGETETVGEPEPHETQGAGAKILDLTEMLQRSLGKRRGVDEQKSNKPGRKTSGKTAGKVSAKKATKAAARKTTKKAGTKAAGKSAAKSTSRSRKAA